MIAALAVRLVVLLLGWSLAFSPGFAARMMEGGELVAYEGTPWGEDEIFREVGATARQSAYTFGYTTGYCGEQVVAGALTGGAAVAGKLLFKETASLAGKLTLRSGFLLKAQLQHLKQTAKSALVAGVLRTQVELGLRAAAKTPLSATDSRTIAEILEYAVSRPNFDRLTFSVKHLIEGIQTLPRLRRLVEVEQAGRLPFEKTAKLAGALGDEATAKALAQSPKLYENVLPLQDNDLDRIDDVFNFLKAGTPQGSRVTREFLESMDTKTAAQLLDDMRLPPSIATLYPKMFHYADASTLIKHADEVAADGTFILHELPDGRYVTSVDVPATAGSITGKTTARELFQLPVKEADDRTKAYTRGSLRCEFDAADVADDFRIPRSARHQDGVNTVPLDWVEIRAMDNPLRGAGGGPQLTQTKPVKVRVTNMETGLPVTSKAEILAWLDSLGLPHPP